PKETLLKLYQDSILYLYKSILKNFYRADYVNKGLYKSGHKYDRYEDKFTYYIKSKAKWYTVRDGNKSDLKQLNEEVPDVKGYLKSSFNNFSDDKLINLLIFMTDQI